MAKLSIHTDEKKSKISRNIYGNFSEHLGRCIYNGIYVGENSDIPNVNGMRTDIVEALKAIKLPVLRWPGGCFADEYHWKDGIGPKETRKKMVNTHWGGVADPNEFGAVLGPAGACIGWAFDGVAWAPPAEPVPSLDDLRAAKLAAISATADVLLAAGAPVGAAGAKAPHRRRFPGGAPGPGCSGGG